MKSLQEHIKQDLQVNESRIRYKDVTNYIKSWLMEQQNTEEVKALLSAINDGIKDAESERRRYGMDEETTDYIIDHIYIDLKK